MMASDLTSLPFRTQRVASALIAFFYRAGGAPDQRRARLMHEGNKPPQSLAVREKIVDDEHAVARRQILLPTKTVLTLPWV